MLLYNRLAYYRFGPMQPFKTSIQWELLSALLYQCLVITKRIKKFWGNFVAFVFLKVLFLKTLKNFDNHFLNSDVLSIACIDAATSILCGCVVFSVLGYVAFTQGKTVDEIARPGPGLIFMVS